MRFAAAVTAAPLTPVSASTRSGVHGASEPLSDSSACAISGGRPGGAPSSSAARVSPSVSASSAPGRDASQSPRKRGRASFTRRAWATVTWSPRWRKPVGGVHPVVAEAAAHAQVLLVHAAELGAARAQDLHPAHAEAHRAAVRAPFADRDVLAQVPRTRLEAVGQRGERPDRAHLDAIAALLARERLAVERRDLRVDAALVGGERVLAHDLVAIADAAHAHD